MANVHIKNLHPLPDGSGFWLDGVCEERLKMVDAMSILMRLTDAEAVATDAALTTDKVYATDRSYCTREPPRRLVCRYCDCISSKESGTCEHCGAPLTLMDY